MKIAYFDPPSGISGDMTVAALLDAGSDQGLSAEELCAALASLGLSGWSAATEPVEVNGLRALSFNVAVDGGGSAHRDWASIRSLIQRSAEEGLPSGAVDRSLSVFSVLAEAEAKVHGVDPDRVHFHEVGAVDSIIDIVGTAWCLDQLGVDQCYCGPLPSGSGYVDCEHGRMPVPAPATVELLAGFELIAGDGEGELVTPTGAAIVKALALPIRPVFALETSGYGAGTRRIEDRPNVLGVLVGHCDGVVDEAVVSIESDLDDMSPEALAFVAERLRRAGARDVSILPVAMKKGRLGTRLCVLCDQARVSELATLILTETSSSGLRYRSFSRFVLPRRTEVVKTSYGPVALKVIRRPDGRESVEPEFDDVSRIALNEGLAFETVRAAALSAYVRR
ncbi:MAG: nickel pincer cofactor biosynthesis protein LarC [Candidatus Krumholzibacteriia bacterium]